MQRLLIDVAVNFTMFCDILVRITFYGDIWIWIVPPKSNVFQSSPSSLYKPFKFADASPIFKSDDDMNKGNFRPVSILSILSKLYKGILNDQILDHFREIFDV